MFKKENVIDFKQAQRNQPQAVPGPLLDPN